MEGTMFQVAVGFTAIDMLTRPMMRMAESMGFLTKRAEETQKKLNEFRNMAFIGGGITLLGTGIADGLKHAIDQAGELQTSIMGVKESLGLTQSEFKNAMNMAQVIGIPTIFSAKQVGDIMKSMATAGLSKENIMDPQILREYVNFADVQTQIKHENGPDLISAAVNMAHQYQLYTSDQIHPFLELLNGALLHTHSTADEFATQYQYIANQARMMGMSAEDTLDTTAWLSRMGFGQGRGGTNFADFLMRSVYHSSGNKADEAMREAGFVANGHSVFENDNGQFVGIPQAIQIMQDFSKRFGGNADVMSPLLHQIFGTQGARIAMMMTTQGASEQYGNVRGQISGSAPINQAKAELQGTWNDQKQQFLSTLTDIGQAFGVAAMPSMLSGLKILNSILETVLKFEQAHPILMQWVAGFASLAAAAALVIGPILVVAGVLGWLKASQSIAIGLRMMSAAFIGLGRAAVLSIRGITTVFTGLFSVMRVFGAFMLSNPIALGIVAIGAILFAFYEAWIHDWGGIRETFAGVANFISDKLHAIAQFFQPVIDKIHEVGDALWGIQNESVSVGNTANDALRAPTARESFSWFGHFASGTNFAPGGMAIVGENGPEAVNLPRGSQVIPNNRIGTGSSNVYIADGAIQINAAPGQNASEIADVVLAKLGQKIRNQSLSRGSVIAPEW